MVLSGVIIFSDIMLESRNLIYIWFDGRHFDIVGVASNIVKHKKLERMCFWSLTESYMKKIISVP